MTSLARNTVLLTAAGIVEFALQFLTPIVFVRTLDPSTFGEYRLVWLMASTALALAPAFMPQSLFYFLPRSTQEQSQFRIGNVLAYLSVAGAAVVLFTSSLNPLISHNVAKLFVDSKGMSSLFLGCWMVASLMTVLPIAEGRVAWQVRNDILLSLVRTILLASAAILTHELIWIMAALMTEALARIGAMIFYLFKRPGGAIKVGWASMHEQLHYSLPFALGSALFQLRTVADQWIIASMLSPSLFGLFSISGIFLSFTGLIRQPITNAIMPRLNGAFAQSNYGEFVRLFRKSSSALTLILVGMSGGLLCVTTELVQIIYTDRYAAAVPVMRIYLISIMFQGCAAGYVLPILNRARSAVHSNACCLVLSVICSYVGTLAWGLPGTASGSAVAFIAGEWWSLHIVARTLGVRIVDLVPWRTLARACSASGIAIAVVFVFAGSDGSPAPIRLAIKGSVFVTVFLGTFSTIGGGAQLRRLASALASNLFKVKKPASVSGDIIH